MRYTMKQLHKVEGYMNFTEVIKTNINKEIACLEECDGCKFLNKACKGGEYLEGCEIYKPADGIKEMILELTKEYNRVGQYASWCCMCRKCMEVKCDFDLYAPDEDVEGGCLNFLYLYE